MVVRVVVAESDGTARSVLVALLAMVGGIEVVAEAASAAEAVAMGESLRPDVVLLGDALAAPACIGALRARSPATRVLVLATYPESAVAAAVAGADSCVLKDAGTQELAKAILALAGGAKGPSDERAGEDPGRSRGLWAD